MFPVRAANRAISPVLWRDPKMALIVWALLAKGGVYRAPVAAV